MTRPSPMPNRSEVPSARGLTTYQSTTPTASTRPHQPATTSPRSRRPLSPTPGDCTSWPPSSGSPGSRLKPASKRLSQDEQPSEHGCRPGSRGDRRPPRAHRGRGWPGAGDGHDGRPARAWCPCRRRRCAPPEGGDDAVHADAEQPGGHARGRPRGRARPARMPTTRRRVGQRATGAQVAPGVGDPVHATKAPR